MKTKLKNRIVSAILALSMLASFLPAGLVAPVYAATESIITGHTITAVNDTTFRVTFVVPGMEGAPLNNYAFALIPDVTSFNDAGSIPSLGVGSDFHPQLGSIGAFEASIAARGAPSAAYYVEVTSSPNSGGAKSFDSNGAVNFTVTMPKSLAETIQGLIGYTKGNGKTVSAADSSIPLVALLWTQGGPNFAATTGTWEGENPAVLEISGGPIDIYGPSPNPLNDLQTEFKNHPLTLTNTGGENAIVSKVVFGAPKLAAIGSAYYWALWYDKDGVLTPLCGDASASNASLKNIGDLITIAPGESVVVYMQRRQAINSLANAIKVGSGTTKITCTNTTIPVNGGTITLTYASEKDGNYTFTDGSADTSWSYKVGGGYNNTTLSVTADQWSTGASNTGTVKRSGTGADPLAITNIALDSNTNAKVTLSGFAEDGSVTVTSGQNQAITGKTATGDLSVKLEPGSTDDAGTWNGNLTITYDNGRTVKVVLTVKVDSVMITDVVTIQKDGTKWTDVPSGTVFTVRKNGIDAPVTGTLSGGEVSFTGLEGGSYNIYADDVDTGVKLLKVGGQVANATVDYYTYTLTAGAGGTVSDSKVTFPSGTSGVFLKGTEIAPTGTPNPGYTGPSWSTTPPATLNAKTELTASFTAKAIKLTKPADVSLTYGSTLSTPVTWQVTDATYSAGDSITYTYTVSAPSGVTFSDYFTISPASGTATSGANTPVTLTAVAGKTPPTGTYTVQVTGESGYNGTTDTPNPIFSITVGAAASASVKILKDGSAYTGYDSSAAANKVTLNGTIDGSYSNTTATYTFSNLVPGQTYNVYQGGADTGKTVTAASGSTTGNTAEIKYWTVSMGAGANVGSKWLDTSASSTSGSGDSYIVKDGGDVYAHATPATGYVGNASWSYSATTHGGSDPTSGNSIHITNITGTLTVTPSYSQYEGTITVNLDGSAYTAFSGTVSVGGKAATKGGNGSTWSYTGATGTAAVTTSDGTPSPAVNVTGTGRNATVNYYSLAISAGTGGTVNSAVNGNYLTGKSVTITATAASGFSFDGWYEPGGSTAVSKAASYSVSMTKKQELEARFKAAAITYNGGSITYIYNNGTPTSTTKDVKGTPNIAGVTFTSYRVASGSSMPDGLTLNADGTISGTPTKAGSYTVEVEATASNGMKPTANWTFTVDKVKLTAPVIAVKNNVSVANGSDGAITVTNPNYPADAGVTYQLYKGTTSTGKGDPTSWEYTGLNAGDYYVQATLGSTNYEWNTTGGNNGKSNTVKITEPGVNSPSLTKTPTYEKNTAVAGRSAAVFDFDAGDWSGLSKLTIDGKDVSLSDITVSAGKTGSITIPATVLDGLSLTNGNKTVTATFSRTGINPLTATASSTLKVQTTYIVSFDVNEPAGKTAPTTPTIANQTATGTSAPNFAWASISNNLSDSSIPGYSFRGWAATEDATTATWTTGNYQPTNMNTTLFAVWLANEVSVTTTLNGSNNSGRTLTLWKDNKATTFTGSVDASGKVTFREVPAGTYQIHDATGDTGLTVTAAAGNTGSARANTVHYYTVEYLAVTSAADHGTYAGGSTPASAEIITNGSAARRTVTLPGTTPDTNYAKGSWVLSPAGAGTAPGASAATWAASSSYTGTSKITLKPSFTRSGASITVNVNRNGSKVTNAINVTLTGPSYSKTETGVTSGTAVFDSLATTGAYTAGVVGWTTSDSPTKSATIPANYADQTITLNYFDYDFDENKAGAMGTVSGMPTSPTAPVLTGAIVAKPADPTMAGYSFRGWAKTPTGSAITWPTTITEETTFHALWLANEVSVTTMLNGANSSGRVITLWKDGKATNFSDATGADGRVTFREVPAGEYQVYDATGDTGLTVTSAEGNTGTTRNATVRYYTVEYLAVTSTADHGTYTDGGTPASVEIITNGSAARRTVTLPGTTPDTNYTRGNWTLTPAGTTAAGAGTAPVASATTWVANSSYTGTSKITLKPNFVRSGASITVNVNRNGSKATETINVTLTGPSGYAKTVSGITSGTAVFDSLATAGRYTAGVDGWTTSGSETKSASITASYADQTITLNYFDYHFNANKPTGAAGTVGNVPADPTAPVLTGASVTAPTGTPTLTGYTFKGWATSATGTPITWPATITAETTFYAIWDADTINLSTGSGQGANGVNKIINFTSPAASGTGHTASDFTYTVEGGSTSTKDGVTITAGASGFTATGTPTRVAAAGNEITFNVKAVSKLNGQEASSTIKITVEPTFTVKYEWNAPSGVTISDAVPTDSNRYIASSNTTAFGLGNSVSATSANPNLGSYTLKGWTYTSGTLTNSTPTNAGTKTGISFSIASAAAAQGIAATGGELVIRALWVGEELSLSLSDLDAVYNMNATSVGKDKWDASLHQWIVDGVDLEAGLSNGSNGARTYSLTDVTGNASSFLEISGSKLQLKSGVRIGNAGTYTFDVTVSDPGTEAKTATARVTLTVAKAMPVIEGLAITAGSHYAGDKTLDAMTYVRVHDPYLASGDTGYTLMDGSTNNKAGWGATNAALQAGNLEYTFMYTPADAENYEKPSEKKTIEVLTRSISLQVQDDDKNLNWSPDYKNENEPTYSPTANWVSITVTIRNPMGNNSPIEELTAQQTAGDTEAFRNIEVTPLDSLAVGDTGVAILTFEVNTHASGSHTLTYEFTGVAGKGLPSEKQAKATYTYTTAAKAATLSTPVPDLNIVEKDKGGDYKDENGAAVNKNNGGIHLHIPAIAEDTGANNPVKEYEVTISGTGWTLPTFTIPATGSATGYDKYWDAGLDGSKPVPDKEYTVTVRAITKDSNLYSSSEKGMDTEKAGYRVLTVADWGKLTNRVFNGTTQNGGSLTSPEGVGAITVQYSDDYNGRNGGSANLEGSKTHVNVTAGAGTNHEYAVFVTVAKGALYLPIEEATLYTPADAWQITQAPATLAVKASNQGKVGQTTELDPEGTASKVTYTTTATTADAYGGSDVTSYYDLTYTIKSGPNTDSSAITGSSFTPKAEGTYVITVHGEYGAKATDQFKADVGLPADKEITVTVADKLLTALEVIGDDREATYGDSNAANFYDASDNVIAKKMGLDDIQVKLTWDSGEVETLTLEEFENRGQITTNFGEISDKKVVFPSAGVATVTMEYSGQSDTIKLTLNPRGLTYHSFGSNKIYDGNTSVNKPGVALDDNQIFATDTNFGEDDVDLNQTEGLTYKLDSAEVGPGRKVQVEGTPKLVGADAGFYIPTGMTEGEVEILPAGFTVKVQTITPTVGTTIPTTITQDPTSDNHVTDNAGNPLPAGTTVAIKWEWNDNGEWKEVTGDKTFQKGTEYRPVVIVTPPSNYQMDTNQPNPGYTINGDTHGENGAEITIDGNVGTFIGAPTKLSSTPILQFRDESSSTAKVNFTRRLSSITEGGTLSPTNIPITFLNINEEIFDVELAVEGDLAQYLTLTPASFDHMTEGQEAVYTLDLSAFDTNSVGTHTLTINAKGAEVAGGSKNIEASYTISFTVSSKPTGGGGTVTIEMPVVTYWVSDNGFTNDLTAEKMSRRGAKPSFVPKITAIEGLKFLGWSESDPTKIKDGTLPTLVDPLTFSITDDKTFYAIYEAVPAGHAHYVIGFPDGTFGPDHPITRGQVATIIARACLEDFAEGSDYGNPGNYNDVEEHWANSAIAFCSLKGVFTGYEDGTFRPDRYISRQELAAVVARLAGVQPNEGLNFVDSGDVANWALNGVYTNVANGWVNGYEDNTFRPLNDITRAETVKIFNGYLHRGVDAEGLSDLTEYVHSGVASNTGSGNEENKEYMTWPDVSKSHWAYFEVIEAANDHDFHWKDATQAVPPEHWDAAFIDDVWRYYDNENDGGEDVGKETPVFTVTYVVNGHGVTYSNTTEQVKIYESPSVEGLPAVVVDEGYYLAGWSEKDPAIHELTEDDIVDPTAHYIEGDKTFYAVFKSFEEYVPETVIVTYVVSKNGETYDAITSEVVWNTMPEQGTIPVAVADAGFIFAGWSDTDPSSGNVTLVDPASTVVTEDRTFYAVFQPTQQPSEPVVYARTKYIGGFEDGTFRPDEAITRAAVAKIIAELLRYDASQTYDADFVDLENHWAKNVIAYCVQRGVMGGYEDGTFRPDGAITRQEFAVIISRLAGTQSNEGLTFTDVDAIAPWALDGVYTAYVHGWINGYEDGTFLPEKVMTRAETVKIFNAYLGRNANVEEINTTTGYTVWNDVPATHWAYYEIVEASNNWGDLPQQDQPAPEEGQVSGENIDETAPVEGDDATAGQPTEGEDPTQTPEEGAQQPGEGETSDQPENGGQDEMQPDNGEDAATPNAGEDPALPNDEENEDNAGEGEDAPTDGDDQ